MCQCVLTNITAVFQYKRVIAIDIQVNCYVHLSILGYSRKIAE